MASRFIFQKLASGVTRSTSLLGAHPSSSARTATTPGTLSNLFHGDAVHHPSNRGIHGFAWGLLSKAARQAKDAVFKPKPPSDNDVDIGIALYAFSALGYILMDTPPKHSSSSRNGSSRCCNCQCHRSNHKVQQD